MSPRDSRVGGRAQEVAASEIDRYALIVGISDYADAKLNLRFAARDASRLREALCGASGGSFDDDHILELVDETATLARLTKALRTFLKRPGPEDLVILFFACHGVRDPERPDNLYLLPHDTDSTDISGTALPMREVELALRETLHSRRVVILMDACHSGGIGDAFAGLRAAGDPAAELNEYMGNLSDSRGGVSLMTSAMANESSLEGEEWGEGHGVFTHCLLEGLRGKADRHPFDGIVTVGELFDYVRRCVEEDTGGRQHPHISGGADREFPLVAMGSMSAAEHLELADRLVEAGNLLTETACLAGAAAHYAEAYRLSVGEREVAARILVKRALALFRAGRADEAERALLTLKREPSVRHPLGMVQLALGKTNQAKATLLQPTPVTPWVAELVERTAGAVHSRVALLVALDRVSADHYEGWTGELKSCVKEISVFGKLLEQEFGFDRVTTLLNADATKAEVLRRLNEAIDESSFSESLVVAFSGHGSQMPDTGRGGLKSTLVAFDDQIGSDEVDEMLRRSRASRTTLIVSTSHSGQFVDQARQAGYEAMSSCASNQFDMDGPDLSVFFEALLPQLSRADAGAEVGRKVKAALSKTNPGQHPQFAIDPVLAPLVSEKDATSPASVAAALLGATAGATARTLEAAARFTRESPRDAVAIEWLRRGRVEAAASLEKRLELESPADACTVLSAAPLGVDTALLSKAVAFLKARSGSMEAGLTGELDEVAALLEQGGGMSRLRAVLVGISKFRDGTGGLRGAGKGVDAVRDALVGAGVPDGQITLLLDGDATRDAVLTALKSAAASRDHAVFVYWAGRGFTSSLGCYDEATIDEREIAEIAGDALTLFTDGPVLGDRRPGETGLPRLTLLQPPKRSGSRAKNGPTVGRHTTALVQALNKAPRPADLQVSSLGERDAPLVVSLASGSEALFPDPLAIRTAALVERIRRSEIAQTRSLIDRLLERRNGADAEAQLQRGMLALNLGSTEEALASFEAAVAQFSGNNAGEARARLELGRALMTTDRARAVSECRQALARDPSLVEAKFWLGRAIAELIEQDTSVQAVEALHAYLKSGAPIGRREEALGLISRLTPKS